MYTLARDRQARDRLGDRGRVVRRPGDARPLRRGYLVHAGRQGSRDPHPAHREAARRGDVDAEVSSQTSSKRRLVSGAILPMCDEPVATVLDTPDGPLEFQNYFVHRGQRDEVLGMWLRGIGDARPARTPYRRRWPQPTSWFSAPQPGREYRPDPGRPGMREALASASVPSVAVSPIVGGRALKGPADRMLASLGVEVSPVGVARMYEGLVDGMVIDGVDEGSGRQDRGSRDACARDRCGYARRSGQGAPRAGGPDFGTGLVTLSEAAERLRGRAGEASCGDQEPAHPNTGPRCPGRSHPLHDGPGRRGAPRRGVENVGVVSPDRIVLARSTGAGATPLRQESRGLNPALEEGRSWAMERGAAAFSSSRPICRCSNPTTCGTYLGRLTPSPSSDRDLPRPSSRRHERPPAQAAGRAAVRFRRRELRGPPRGSQRA